MPKDGALQSAGLPAPPWPDASLSLPSAGVGRTGTLIALDVLLRQLECEGLGVGPWRVKKMRESRPLMVQTEVRGSPGWAGGQAELAEAQEGAPPPPPCSVPRPSTSSCTSASFGFCNSQPQCAGSGGGHLREPADGECSCYRGLSCGRAETPCPSDTDSAPLLQPRCLGPGTAEGWVQTPGPEGREGTGSPDSYFLERGRAQILDLSLKKERDGGPGSLLVFV